MKRTLLFLAVLLLAAGAPAQTATPAPGQAQAPRTPPPSPGMSMPGMGMFHPPAALAAEFWKDPDTVAELHLTDAQVKALEQASLNMKLAAIDSGAGALKSFVQVQALLDADQVDQAGYDRQLDLLSASVTKLIKDFGAMALTIRKTLSAEQWHKLEALRALRAEQRRPVAPRPDGPRRRRQPANPPM